MNIKNILKISLGAAALVATQMSCINDDKWDAPEIVCNNKFDAPTMTMAQFVALSPATVSTIYTGEAYKVPAEDATHPAVIFDAYVVSSDAGGNFYKTISFQDKPENPTVGLTVGINKSLNYADFPVGAHIRIKANGMVIGKSFGVISLGVPDPDYTIGRIPESIIGRFIAGVCDGNGLEIATIVPKNVTLEDLKKNDSYLNTLVKVSNVQFGDGLAGKQLMNKDLSGAFVDTDRAIEDVYGNAGTIRTDGFFKATSYLIPENSGDITFVASKYNATYQNIIRSISDINLTKPRITYTFNEPFANLTANGWTTYSVAGAPVWGTTNFGNPAPSAYMNGNGSVNEDWLISKSIPLTGFASAGLLFQTDGRYAGNALEVYITTDTYNGGNPTGLTWVKLNAKFDTDMNAFAGFVSSGLVDLAPYLNKNVRIGFKYTSTASAASAWEVDNVKIYTTK